MTVLSAVRFDARVLRLACAALAASLLSFGLAASAPQAASATQRLVSVIVRGPQAAAAVESSGGEVTRRLPIVDGVSARVPSNALDQLGARGYDVSKNSKIGFHVAFDGSKTAHQLTSVTNSKKLQDEGISGNGVTVALLDTGVYNHPDLAGRVVHCEDFTHEADTEAHCADTFGHGTFMAGQIAGNGTSSAGKYRGSAPGADIVSVKLAGFDGSTDVSTVLAGIQWAVAHKDQYRIRVMNLSLGSDSSEDYRLSPLNFAVEKAWEEGIVVVVSASNSGPDNYTITKPGDDPYVITVGAQNHEGNVDVKDDMVPVFSSRGPTRSNGFAKPDVVAPGVHTVSLRSPGSAIDQKYCESACVGDSYFKGTGTSMSTAYTSGVVAQMLQVSPDLHPDHVKHRLLSTARQISETDPLAVGHGAVDAYAAAKSTSTERANRGIAERSSGLGLLQGSRGSIELTAVTPAGEVAVTGEMSAQLDEDGLALNPYSGLTYTSTGWDPTSWDGSAWKLLDWAGSAWKGSAWKATVWDGSAWKGSAWKNADWDGSAWKGIDWDGSAWKGSAWKSYWYAAAWD